MTNSKDNSIKPSKISDISNISNISIISEEIIEPENKNTEDHEKNNTFNQGCRRHRLRFQE